jgi:hypothetical protein
MRPSLFARALIARASFAGCGRGGDSGVDEEPVSGVVQLAKRGRRVAQGHEASERLPIEAWLRDEPPLGQGEDRHYMRGEAGESRESHRILQGCSAK